jgi:GTP cyclohydrolase II
MSFAPTLTEELSRARADLRMGVPILLDGPEPLLFLAAETLEQSRFALVKSLPNDAAMVITARRAETLKARAYDGDLARVVIPETADLAWVRGMADPANDLRYPMKGPLTCARGGDVTAYRMALRLVKSARLLPALVAVGVENAQAFASEQNITILPVEEVQPLLDERSRLHEIAKARLPTEVSETGCLHVFRPEDGGEEHYAIEIGRPDRSAATLVRLHSACFTGDLMGSLKCDCGPQLRAALSRMGEEGSGVLLYMNQEGRGIGLANKMRAYSLQDQGFDTVEANHRLGFEDDERDFRLGADILKSLGFSSIRLLTNNPGKVAMMQTCGIEVVDRVALRAGENAHNHAYLAAKAAKSGHLL